MKTNIKDIEIITACESSRSMAEACRKVNLHWNTFRKKAIELGGLLNKKIYIAGLDGDFKRNKFGYILDVLIEMFDKWS